jgi:predicted DNA-binding transcriptional regulator YafY
MYTNSCGRRKRIQTNGSWLIIAFCRLRNDYRMFRPDRILEIEPRQISLEPHELILKDFLGAKEKNFGIPDIPLS